MEKIGIGRLRGILTMKCANTRRHRISRGRRGRRHCSSRSCGGSLYEERILMTVYKFHLVKLPAKIIERLLVALMLSNKLINVNKYIHRFKE